MPHPKKMILLFDDMGQHLSPDPFSIARRLGLAGDGTEMTTQAVRDFGCVALGTLRDAILVTLAPDTVSHLAAFAAFYEIARRAPTRLILAFLSENGEPSHYEIFFSRRKALKRVETILEGRQHPLLLPQHGAEREISVTQAKEYVGFPQSKAGNVYSFRGHNGLAVRVLREDCSRRLCRPIESIPAADGWMGSLLRDWQIARKGPRLPSIDSLASLRLLGAAQGRAHILDTSETDPTGYWFRLWGPVNSYGTGHTRRSLSQMPAGLMRETAIEDYWDAVSMGVARYHLIDITADRVAYSYARLLLPFANDGRRVDHLLALINERDLASEMP
jgi:hypothetical protein